MLRADAYIKRIEALKTGLKKIKVSKRRIIELEAASTSFENDLKKLYYFKW